MSRRGSLAALALCVALVGGTLLALVGGIALGAWRPAGPARPTATPPAVVARVVGYGEFIDDVRAGHVSFVNQNQDVLEVSADSRQYTVQLPPGDPDVFGDVQAAAEAGGVPTPGFNSNVGPDETPEPLTYPAFLDQVKAGRIYEVIQTDDRLELNAVDGPKTVAVPSGARVLDDIEAAANAGGIPPPPYTKLPGQKGPPPG